MKLTKQKIQTFQKTILTWYSLNQRDLPWRKTRAPYHILVAEVMLQQTQVSRVIPKYETWLEVFPTVEALANASIPAVLRMWSGLGYNRRALNVQKAAKAISIQYQGQFPKDPKELETLPGIGTYTAAAVACFAFDKQIPVVDTNIRKVITVEFFEGRLPREKIVEEVAWQLLPQGSAYHWNQALMDYSSMVLREHKIPIPRQSHFLSSDRFIRGQTIKLLLEGYKLSFITLQEFLAAKGRTIEAKHLQKILIDLEKEGFIILEKNVIRLRQ